MNYSVASKAKKSESCSMFSFSKAETIKAHTYEIRMTDVASSSVFSKLKTGFYGRVEYFNALKEGIRKDSNLIFPEVYCNGILIAAGCFQELRLAAKDFNEPGNLLPEDSKFSKTLEKTAKSVMRIGTGKNGLRILIAGNSQVSGPFGLFFSEAISAEEHPEIWKITLEEIERQAGPFSVVIVKDMALRLKPVCEILKTVGFKSVPVSPIMSVDIDPAFTTFEEYTNAMTSKYRIRVKSARRKGISIVRKIWSAEDIETHSEEIGKLYNNVYDKAKFRLFRINREYFHALKLAIGEELLFTAYLHDNKLVGFSTLLMNGVQCDAHLIGIDYSANKEYSLYQNMLYDYVEAGINYGTKRIDLGRTAMEIKSTVGATPEESAVLIRLKNPVLNGIATLLLDNVKKQDWIQRHPFRHDE